MPSIKVQMIISDLMKNKSQETLELSVNDMSLPEVMQACQQWLDRLSPQDRQHVKINIEILDPLNIWEGR